ncbi:recombinase family protein [Streptosporangium canum]|uniref:recombinase family protein n=1 Tax=Streptosporangium canum TaxID=324952 RepID=UPI0033AC0D65
MSAAPPRPAQAFIWPFIFQQCSPTSRTTFDERKAGTAALIGLVQVSTDTQKTERQHDALDPICLKVFEEKASGKLATDERPTLLEALSHIRDGGKRAAILPRRQRGESIRTISAGVVHKTLTDTEAP